jgi:tetrahydromethanopterin S-methyltransferase subunit C
MKLRSRAFGLAIGIVWGLAVFVSTIWDVAVGMGKTMALLGVFYPGYSVSYGGAVIGLIWGFVNGFLFGATVAWLYNKMHNTIYKSDVSGS